jgi:hypothetical protein
MLKLFMLASLISVSALAQSQVDQCAADLVRDIDYHVGRAVTLCQRAQKNSSDLTLFETCLTAIHKHTKLAPEIIAPYCIRHNEPQYRACVISTYNSNSNDNAFKSCLNGKKRAPSSIESPQSVTKTLSAPETVTISVSNQPAPATEDQPSAPHVSSGDFEL